MTEKSVNSLSGEELLEKYGRLIHKNSQHEIPGLTHDDIFQELCIIALRCQKRFDPTHIRGAKFSTYLVNALQRRVFSLAGRTNMKQGVWGQLEDNTDRRIKFADPVAGRDFSRVELEMIIGQLSSKAQRLCRKIMDGPRRVGLSFRRGDKKLVAEISSLLGDAYNIPEVR